MPMGTRTAADDGVALVAGGCSMRSSCASLVMRWRDCQRQSFHSPSSPREEAAAKAWLALIAGSGVQSSTRVWAPRPGGGGRERERWRRNLRRRIRDSGRIGRRTAGAVGRGRLGD